MIWKQSDVGERAANSGHTQTPNLTTVRLIDSVLWGLRTGSHPLWRGYTDRNTGKFVTLLPTPQMVDLKMR